MRAIGGTISELDWNTLYLFVEFIVERVAIKKSYGSNGLTLIRGLIEWAIRQENGT